MDKLSYSIQTECDFTHSVLVFVYELIDELNECYDSYLIIFTKTANNFTCYQPRVPPHVKQWLVDTKVIELQKDRVVLSPISLLQIL
jgi:hypothetical protein